MWEQAVSMGRKRGPTTSGRLLKDQSHRNRLALAWTVYEMSSALQFIFLNQLIRSQNAGKIHLATIKDVALKIITC